MISLTPIETPEAWQKLDCHKFCLALPDMDSEAFNHLTRSINDDGWDARHPIVLYNGKVLDGRNRLKAALTLKTAKPEFAELVGTDEDAFAFSFRENVARRHMTKGERATMLVDLEDAGREMVGTKTAQTCANTEQEAIFVRAKGVKKTTERLAHEAGISPRLLEQTRELKRVDPAAFQRVKNEKKSIVGELKKAKLDKTPKTPPIPPKPKAKDDAGAPINPRARKALTDGRERFATLTKELHAIKRSVLALCEDAIGRKMAKASIETDFGNILRQLRYSAPYSSCPMDDACAETCKLCQGTQWITESQYASLPPKFKKGAA